MDKEWETRVAAFKAELETLLENYNVELHSDPYDGSFDLYSTTTKDREYNFKFVRGGYYRG